MLRTPKGHWTLAASLAALAGYTDAIGFLKLGGLFVSFMSGNSTRLAVAAAERSALAFTAASLILSFLAGVVAGTLLAFAAGRRRKAAVLALASLLLGLSVGLDGTLPETATALLLAGAMGAMNCVFQRNGEVSIGVTYMTGTLVKLGQHLGGLILGRDRWGWAPYLLLWSGLAIGAFTGASLYPAAGMACLWAACTAAALLAAVALRLGPAAPAGGSPGAGKS